MYLLFARILGCNADAPTVFALCDSVPSTVWASIDRWVLLFFYVGLLMSTPQGMPLQDAIAPEDDTKAAIARYVPPPTGKTT